MATLPGYQLYVRYGFVETGRGPITLPDGVELEGVAMEMPVREG
jgi:hypothetical protein